MSSNDDNIFNTINFTLTSDLSLIYKKVFLKKYIDTYLNDNNKEQIINMIKDNNNEIYNYIFLDKVEKNKIRNKKSIDTRKRYIENHKEELKEKRKQYYQEHREEQLNKCKENYRKKKEILKNQLEENK